MAVSLKKEKQEIHTWLRGHRNAIHIFQNGTDSPNYTYKLFESQSKLTGS
jgi:hypothetical protein